MIKIKSFVFNPFYENTYLVYCSDSLEGMVIDPGMYFAEEKNEFCSYISSESINLKYVLNTHCHIDHSLGNKFIVDKYKAELIIPEKDKFLLELLKTQGSMFELDIEESPDTDNYFENISELKLGENKFNFFHTPGHSPGEYCVYSLENSICFTGDLLFKEGIGRTDLWGGNLNELMDSIKKLFSILHDDIKIFPGHGEFSTIGYEKRNNPYIAKVK
ncbi:MAG: MBL fold metallo-hydrolase [Melioribacteraceae bacterium]|nr:MBL fold metallo-hydrolase [Melioribacteraceae bacterium]